MILEDPSILYVIIVGGGSFCLYKETIQNHSISLLGSRIFSIQAYPLPGHATKEEGMVPVTNSLLDRDNLLQLCFAREYP